MTPHPHAQTPGPLTDHLEDRFGDSLNVSPGGAEHVLIEIVPAKASTPAVSIELPSAWMPRLCVALVKATGRTPEQLSRRSPTAPAQRSSFYRKGA